MKASLETTVEESRRGKESARVDNGAAVTKVRSDANDAPLVNCVVDIVVVGDSERGDCSSDGRKGS